MATTHLSAPGDAQTAASVTVALDVPAGPGDAPIPAGPGAGDADLLDAVGFALSSRLELADVLRLLADAARRATAAARCSILLVDGDVLVPAASVSDIRDEQLFAVYRAMDPVAIDAMPQLGALLEGATPLTVTDARASSPIPPPWAQRFGLVACALVPLRAGSDIAGLMVVDHPEPGHFDNDRVRMLTALGRYAGVAVRDARVHAEVERRAALMTQVAAAATTLANADEVAAVARVLADAGCRLADGDRAATVLLDPSGSRARVVPATGCGAIAAMATADLPAAVTGILATDQTTVRLDTPGVDHGADAIAWPSTRALVASLVFDGRARGALVVAVPAGHVAGTAECDAATTLASVGAAAIERALLVRRLDEQLWRLEVLGRAGTMLVEAGTAEQLAGRIGTLLSRHGIEVLSLALRQRRLVQLLGGPRPTDEERAAIDGREPVTLTDGTVAVPLRNGRRVLGVMRVRVPRGTGEDIAFLATLGRVVAELVERAAIRLELDAATRDRQTTADRDRLGTELQTSIRRLLESIGDAARIPDDETPAASWRRRLDQIAEVAETGTSELMEAERAQAFLPSADRGVATAIRELARSVAADAGIDVVVSAPDTLDALPRATAWALFRVAHRALTAAWHDGQAAVIRVLLSANHDTVSMAVRDDGASLTHRPGADAALLAMRRAIAAVDGTVHVQASPLSGIQVTARAPAVTT